MTGTIRPISQNDAEACGRVAYEAHYTVATKHGFPPEQPSVEFSIGLVRFKLQDPNAWGVLAERDGRIIGSMFLNMFPPSPVAAIGPLTVHPSAEGGAGRQLMAAALEEANRRGIKQVRLVQSPSHIRSLVLYAKMGFEVREPLAFVQGEPIRAAPSGGRSVRPVTSNDLAVCNRLCVTAHGFTRELELQQSIEQGTATVVEKAGQITGYATGIGVRGHAVAETTEDLKTLIAYAQAILGPGFFVPIRNAELFRWLLDSRFRIGWPATLMTIGEYKDPSGAFLPSIAF
jgi:GNAT superfamily N-acetyltransferase